MPIEQHLITAWVQAHGELIEKLMQAPVGKIKAIENMLADEKKEKVCWTCKYLGNWGGENFVGDFTCEWFPRHGKGQSKKLMPNKDPDDGCDQWQSRK